MKLLRITELGIKECLRRKVLYGIIGLAFLFVLMARGCDHGTVRGERMLLDAQTRTSIAASVTFHGIALWSFLLCSLLSATALSREIEDGTALLVLSRPVRHAVFVAGKLLASLCISVAHLAVLAALMKLFNSSISTAGLLMGLVCCVPLLLLCTLMTCFLSLVLPRVIAPLLSIVVYATACWAALPYYFDKLRIIWTPSHSVARMYQLLPCFGDLQFMGAALLRGEPAGGHAGGTILNVVVYCVVLWCATVMCFSRRISS